MCLRGSADIALLFMWEGGREEAGWNLGGRIVCGDLFVMASAEMALKIR